MPGAHEVYVLLDQAADLAAHDESLEGLLLGLTAGMLLAADGAVGEPESSIVVPASVRECVVQAAERTKGWDPAELSTTGHLLVMLVADLVHDLGV